MTIELKLDTAAMMALFPEGSEARVKLQNAVLVEVTKRIGIKQARLLSDELATALAQGAEKAAREAMQDYLQSSGYYTPTLSNGNLAARVCERIKVLIHARVEEDLRRAVESDLAELQKRLTEELTARFEQRIEAAVERRVDVLTEQLINQKVAERFSAALAAATKGG